MKGKINSVFLLLLSFAIYDKLVKYTTEFPVNLVVFYYVSFYSFVIYTIYKMYNEAVLNFDKSILFILACPFSLRLFLNLAAINKTRDQYNDLVSNEFIDFFTWGFLIIGVISMLWAKYTQSQR